MDCRNHPGTEAAAVCAACAEGYCGHCLVTVRGTRYCASCKSAAIPAGAAPAASVPCPEASDALKFALASFVCFGIIFGAIAINKGLQAKKLIAANPALKGEGRAQAAIVVGAIGIAFWLIGMMQRLTSAGR